MIEFENNSDYKAPEMSDLKCCGNCKHFSAYWEVTCIKYQSNDNEPCSWCEGWEFDGKYMQDRDFQDGGKS